MDSENTEFVLHRLQRIAAKDEMFESAAEIADALGLGKSTVAGILNRLERDGRAQKMGVSRSGARTWTAAEGAA